MFRKLNEKAFAVAPVRSGRRTKPTEVRIMKKGRKMRPYPNGPNRGEGYRLGAFKCENEGVYNEVNDRSLSHEKRAQDVPLSSVWS